jgi:polyvinyl alcohol dehydrogenase (cytochrome)
MSPERVLAAMETGEMVYMAARWPVAGRRAIAEFVTGKKLGTAPPVTTSSPSATCPPGSDDFARALVGPRWNGWGPTTSNTRFQDAATAGFTASEVLRLKLKWAFGYPGDILVTANGAPTVGGGRVFVASPGGSVYSLSAATGSVSKGELSQAPAGQRLSKMPPAGKMPSATCFRRRAARWRDDA